MGQEETADRLKAGADVLPDHLDFLMLRLRHLRQQNSTRLTTAAFKAVLIVKFYPQDFFKVGRPPFPPVLVVIGKAPVTNQEAQGLERGRGRGGVSVSTSTTSASLATGFSATKMELLDFCMDMQA